MLVIVICRCSLASFLKRLLSVDGVIDFVPRIENPPDPEVLTDVLHFEEHPRERECLRDTVTFVEQLQPLRQAPLTTSPQQLLFWRRDHSREGR